MKNNLLKNSFRLFLILLLPLNVLFAQVPTISSFSPLTGTNGTSVTISGTNFNTTVSNNVVFFGSTRANVSAASATSLTVQVPIGAICAPITVVNMGTSLSASSNGVFSPTSAQYKTNPFVASDFETNVNLIADRQNIIQKAIESSD